VNHRLRALGRGRLNHRQIKLIIAEALKGVVGFDELNEKGVRAALATRPAVEITQERRLVGTAQKDLRITTIELAGDGGPDGRGDAGGNDGS